MDVTCGTRGIIGTNIIIILEVGHKKNRPKMFPRTPMAVPPIPAAHLTRIIANLRLIRTLERPVLRQKDPEDIGHPMMEL